MPLSNFMTATATTQRATLTNGKRGDAVTYLQSVKIAPIMLAPTRGMHAIRQAIGLDGTAVQVFETYTEAHTHTKNAASVIELPDIIAGDRLIIDGVTYNVRWAEAETATSGFGKTLIIYFTEDKRA